MTIRLIFPESKNSSVLLGNTFVASDTPFFIGVILKPSDPSWARFKKSHEIILGGRVEAEFSIKYNIDIGESTIFFLSPLGDDVTRSWFLG